MRLSASHAAGLAAVALGMQGTAHAQDVGPPPAEAAAPADEATSQTLPGEPDSAVSGTDILSGNTLSLLFDGRIVAVSGERSFLDRAFGKTRFSSGPGGDFDIEPMPVEADLIWTPRFSNAVSGNVSVSWQRDQENEVDLLEAFMTFLPPRGERISFSAKAGLYWPEISLEHATGGAWSTVHTITPSAINSWIGEEVKIIGAEATITLTLGKHDVSLTGGVFGFNDTSGTLLSFRGWALHDLKATAFGHIPLPILSFFMTGPQAPKTRSLLEIDDRVGFYGRFEWRPPSASAFALNAFYYDNRGDPTAFLPSRQWGWRTRFANVGISLNPGSSTRVLAQAMYGTTQMGIIPPGLSNYWIDTRYRSAFVLVAQDVAEGRGQVSGRFELFDTHERGTRMSPDESETGGAATLAGRWRLNDMLTGFVEVMHVRSRRGVRTRVGDDPFQAQTVVPASLRLRL
jgi:hypothetical protein